MCHSARLRPRGHSTVTITPGSFARHCCSTSSVLDTLNRERFADTDQAAIHATLLDKGRYLGSVRTLYRVLRNASTPLRQSVHELTVICSPFGQSGWVRWHCVPDFAAAQREPSISLLHGLTGSATTDSGGGLIDISLTISVYLSHRTSRRGYCYGGAPDKRLSLGAPDGRRSEADG